MSEPDWRQIADEAFTEWRQDARVALPWNEYLAKFAYARGKADGAEEAKKEIARLQESEHQEILRRFEKDAELASAEGEIERLKHDLFVTKTALEVERRPAWQKGAIDRPANVDTPAANPPATTGAEAEQECECKHCWCERMMDEARHSHEAEPAPAPTPRAVCEKGCVTGCDGFGCAAPAPAEKVFETLDAMDKRHADAVADLKRQVDALESPSLTDSELQQMEARANAATAGPWTWVAKKGTREEVRNWLLACYDASQDVELHGAGIAAPGTTIEDECLTTAITGNGPTSKANAIFVTHARTDLPRLVTAYRALQAECERLRGYQSKNHALREEVGSLSEEVARLKEALTEIRQPHYGVEMTDTDAEQLEYWSKRCVALMDIARRALRGAK